MRRALCGLLLLGLAGCELAKNPNDLKLEGVRCNTEEELCAKDGGKCGMVTVKDDCGAAVEAWCGGCGSGKLCGGNEGNVCVGSPLTDEVTLLAGTGPANAWAATRNGAVIRWDGKRWSPSTGLVNPKALAVTLGGVFALQGTDMGGTILMTLSGPNGSWNSSLNPTLQLTTEKLVDISAAADGRSLLLLTSQRIGRLPAGSSSPSAWVWNSIVFSSPGAGSYKLARRGQEILAITLDTSALNEARVSAFPADPYSDILAFSFRATLGGTDTVLGVAADPDGGAWVLSQTTARLSTVHYRAPGALLARKLALPSRSWTPTLAGMTGPFNGGGKVWVAGEHGDFFVCDANSCVDDKSVPAAQRTGGNYTSIYGYGLPDGRVELLLGTNQQAIAQLRE